MYRDEYWREPPFRAEIVSAVLPIRRFSKPFEAGYFYHIMLAAYSPALLIRGYLQLVTKAVSGVFSRPWRIQETFYQMDLIGSGSVPLILVAGIATGMALTIQGAYQLAPIGAVHQVSKLISLTFVREVGPVLTAIMITGRVGSAIAAELASMKATEQVDAIRAMGIDPIKALITPRLIACVLMVPILTILLDAAAMAGGWLISILYLGRDPLFHWVLSASVLHWSDIALGLGKPVVSGFILATVAGYVGFTVAGGLGAIGRAATTGMIAASLLILAFDVLITMIVPLQTLAW